MLNTYLCKESQLPDLGSCKEFRIGEELFFAVHQSEQIYIYRNSCPHIGMPLNWQPDKFLSADNSFIQCTSHGALFEIDSGLCVAGPCHGQSLQVVEYDIRDKDVFI